MKLLSFGEEEEEGEQSMAMIPKLKGKSSHDLTNDPTLSAVPAVESDERSADREEKQKYFVLIYHIELYFNHAYLVTENSWNGFSLD